MKKPHNFPIKWNPDIEIIVNRKVFAMASDYMERWTLKTEQLLDFLDDMKEKDVLSVACGYGRFEYELHIAGYQPVGTDVKHHPTWEVLNKELGLEFHVSDIFDLNSFPKKASIVNCCECLEHLPNYKQAFANLLELTEKRLIVTVPWRRSYNDPDHKNYWDDDGTKGFKSIKEFAQMADPHPVSFHKIRTKPSDVKRGQQDYVLVINKV